MPHENSHPVQPDIKESADVISAAESFVDDERETNNNNREIKTQCESRANTVADARTTLETLNGAETTPENEARVREARNKIGESGSPEEKEEAKEKKKEDEIKNDQAEDSGLNLNEVESRIVEVETHQRAERHEAIATELKVRVIPKLLGQDIQTLADLQLKLGCESENDLVRTCEKLLKLASPATSEGVETSDMLKSIGNLKTLSEIFVAAFKLHATDDDFRVTILRDDPEAALASIQITRQVESIHS